MFFEDSAAASEYEAVSRNLYSTVLQALVTSVNDDFPVGPDLG